MKTFQIPEDRPGFPFKLYFIKLTGNNVFSDGAQVAAFIAPDEREACLSISHALFLRDADKNTKFSRFKTGLFELHVGLRRLV